MPTHNDLSRSRLADTYGALDLERRPQPSEAELYGSPGRTPAAAPARRPMLYGNPRDQEMVDIAVPPALRGRWLRIGARLRLLRESQSQSEIAQQARASDIQYTALATVRERVQEAVVDAWESQLTALERSLNLTDE